MPEQPNQQIQPTQAPQELRQSMLDQIEAGKKAIEALSDEELEAVAGGKNLEAFRSVNTTAVLPARNVVNTTAVVPARNVVNTTAVLPARNVVNTTAVVPGRTLGQADRYPKKG